MTFLVEQAALMMTIQDRGRFGYRRYGMPESGPMDWWAHRCANQLVGNTLDTACVEVGYSSASITAVADALLAVCGAGYSVHVNNRPIPTWMSFWVKQGDQILLSKETGGQWVYIAVQGGIQSQVWMGSRSMYIRGGLGSQIKDGDIIEMKKNFLPTRDHAGRMIPLEMRPKYQESFIIRVISGPHKDRFSDKSISDFYSKIFSLSLNSDRMGYRLTGPKLIHTHGADLVSQGMVIGEIQVPQDGQPIVMMPDHPTTGGYTCIASVIKTDLPLLAQAGPTRSEIQFKEISVEEAQKAYRDIVDELDSYSFKEEDSWLQY
jgi:antagonist of KipI